MLLKVAASCTRGHAFRNRWNWHLEVKQQTTPCWKLPPMLTVQEGTDDRRYRRRLFQFYFTGPQGSRRARQRLLRKKGGLVLMPFKWARDVRLTLFQGPYILRMISLALSWRVTRWLSPAIRRRWSNAGSPLSKRGSSRRWTNSNQYWFNVLCLLARRPFNGV